VKAGYPDDAFYKTASQAELAVNAAYQPLSFSNDQNRLWVFGDVASDDADKGGNPGDQADIGNIDDFVADIPDQWKSLKVCGEFIMKALRAVTKYCNRCRQLQWIKYCKTGYWVKRISLRAYYYFYLVNIFGPVPLILEPKNAQELQIPQSPVAEIYANAIEADCKAAIDIAARLCKRMRK
jgi:hypothetical protein